MTDLDAVDAMMEGLRAVYGMAQKGCDAPNAAYRWCERIDEVFHDFGMAGQYSEYAEDLPPAARELVPALAAEVRAQQATIENLRQMERNVQSVREFEHQRAEKALATIAALEKRVEALTGGLQEIARQKKTDEQETEYDAEVADFEGGYDACIDCARAALSGDTP